MFSSTGISVNPTSSTPAISPGTDGFCALQAQDLNFYYDRQQVLESISIAIPWGEITAIIGPSGCGKSTLLKAFNRIGELEGKVRVTGKVEFLGQNIYGPRVNLNRLRQQIGMVFQKPNPFPISIYDNVAYGVQVAGPKRRTQLDAIVEMALQQAALWDEVKDSLRKSAFSLSGGQQQRLCIARALAVQPKVLLMDEPCSALDPVSTAKIEELILTLRQRLTIVIVTHNLQQASRTSHYTAFFSTDESRIGQLIEMAPTQQIFTSPRDQRTRNYIEGRFG